MKQTVFRNDFLEAFRKADRFDQFGYDALNSLFDYFMELESSIGYELNLDVVDICCDFAIDTWQNIAANYGVDVEGMTDEEGLEAVREWLADNSNVVDVIDDKIVYSTAF